VSNVQWKTPDDGQRNCPKHVEFRDKNKFGKISASVGFIKKKQKHIWLCFGVWNLIVVSLVSPKISFNTEDDSSNFCGNDCVHLQRYSTVKTQETEVWIIKTNSQILQHKNIWA